MSSEFELSETEKSLGHWLKRPYVKLAIIIVVLILLMFVAIKAGFDVWLLSKIGMERLVSERGEPDFWQIGNELAAYKASQVAPMRAEATSDSSGSGSPQVQTVASATPTATASGVAVPAGAAVATNLSAVQAAGAAAQKEYMWNASRRPLQKREYITGNMGKIDSARLMAILS